MGNRISTEDLYKITQSLADRAVSDVKKRREDERKREEAIKKNREERLAAAAKQNRIPNYKGGSLWDQYKAALASGEAKNANDFITKRDARNAAWNKVGAETLNDDMEALAKSISSTYGTQFDPSKYYSQETINGSSDQVKKMRDRLNALAEYYNTYGGSDDQKKAVGEQIKAYDSELKFLNDLGAHYGQYSSPEAYETLYDNGFYTEKYQGKNYSDIQNALKSTTNDREKAWLEKNADSFMTAAEAQAEIDRIEKAMGTKNIAGQRWTTGLPKIENGKLVYNDNLYDKETGKRLQKLEAIRDSKINKETLEDYGRYLGEANEFATERALFLAKQNNILQHGNETFGVFAPDAKAPYAKNENAQNEASRLSPEKLKAVNEQSGQAFSFLDNADWATDDEKKIYDYLLYYKGGEEAKKYLRALSYELNRRAANALDQTVSDMYDNASGLGKTVLNIGSLGMNIIGNPEAAIDTIAHRIVGERVDPNSNNQTFRRIRNVIREKTGADLAKASEGTIFGKELFGENAANMLYGAAMSSLDSLLGGFTFGEGYTAVMGGGAMADEAERLYNKGASDSQIFNRSFAAGLAEYITEKVSMDNLLKAKSPANGWQVAKEILKQAGIEGSEEMASDVLNLVADSIIMADRSEMSESIQKYKDGYIDDNGTYHKGVSEKEAQKLAWQDFFTDAMADGLAGALSGGMMSAGPTIASYKYSKNRAAIQIPSIDPGNAEGLVSNARINDISVLTDVSEALKNGDAEEAGGVISEGIAWYEFLKKYGEKTYGKNQWSEVRGSIDDSISELKKIQKLVADGSIDAAAIDEVLKTAETSMKTTPTVDVTSANDEKLFSLLAKGEPSNSVIEKNILKDRGTLAAFERLTGLRIGGTTVSQKRADVREAFKAVSSSIETLKAAQNAIESGATATEGHKNAAVIIDQAIQANRAENSRLRNSEKVKSAETKAAIDATNRQHRFLETVRNYVINGGDLSGFTESPVSNVSGEGGTNSSETKTTQETAKKRVRADFSAYQDERYSAESASALANLNSKAEQDAFFRNENAGIEQEIKNIESSDSITAEEKAQRIGELKEAASRNNSLAKAMDDFREMGRLVRAGEVDKIVDSLRKPLKKMGVNIEVVDNVETADGMKSGAYFDKSTNTIKVSRDWNGVENVVKLELAADGNGFVLNSGKSVSFDRAVTQTIAHEIAHADSGLTLDFIKAVAGTQYDAFDLKGRLEHPDDRSWRSEDAQKEKNWRRYVDAYTEQAMLEMKGTEEQRRASTEKVVNDAYIFEEIMADMFGAAVDDMGHSSKAGENIFWAMNRNKPGIIKRILNALERFIARIRGKDAYLAVEQRQAAERLRDMLTGELKRAYGTDVKGEAAVESDGGKKYSIVYLDDGKTYVTASRNVISGNDVNQWRKQITNFFTALLEGNKSIDIETVEGDTLTITKKETARKARDNFKQENGKPVRMSDNEFRVKLNVEAHIDEIAETARSSKNTGSADTKSHAFAKDGFTYRTAYFEDFNGDYYRVRLSIGNNGTVATVYNVGKMTKDVPASAKILAVVGSKPLAVTSSDNSISQDSRNVNRQFSEISDAKTIEDGGTVENDSGEFVAESDGNGGTRWSLSTYESSGRETLRQYLDGQVSESGLTEADAKAVLDSMDDIYEICRKYEGEYVPFGAWSRAEVVIDEKGNPVFSVIKPNGEYAMNLDFSLVCKKRRALDAVLNRLIETGAINDFGFGQEEIVRVNEIIREHGFEIACDMCFVDAKRYRQAGVADQFVDLYNSIVKSMAKDGQEIDYFNFANDSSLSHTEGGIDRLSDAELDFSEINEITKPGAKKTMAYRVAQYLKTHPADRKLLSRGDFMSTAGFDAVKASKPDILKIYNVKKGAGGPKAAQSDVQYLNDILSSKKFNRNAAYDVGGVRVQSFSDYVPRLVFDYVQMIGDLAAKRLPAHAYTKEPLFAKQFGLTGMKINMSLMPAKGNGKYAGLNADGSYAWARESFPAEEAFRIQADPEYGKNVGTIAVGISDEHIWKMLSDPDIRMVIPYHKSGINPAVAVKLKIGEYTNYTDQQNTRRRDGRQLTKSELKNIPDINRLMHRDGLDAVEASRRYVEWCEDNGYIPKFEKFAYMTDSDGSRVFNENYYKLLEDFTTMVDGEFHPQGDVTATFPGSDSAFGSMADLIKEGLEEDAVTANRLNGEVDGLAEEVRSALGREESGKRFSLSSNVEQTKDLIAVHNMTAAELEKSLDLGGLPMPSIAIIKAADGHSEYGDVSLVFGKDTIDPKKSARNKVYGGDAWTPTFPKIDYKANEKVGKRIRDKYYDLSRKYGYDNTRALYNYAQDLSDVLTSEGGEKAMIDRLYGDTGMMQIYLMDTGRERIANVNKETKTALTDGQVRQYENLIDTLGRDEMNGFAKKDREELSDLVRRRKAFIEENEAGIRKAFEKTFIEDGMSAKDAAEVSAELALSDLRKYVLDTFNYIKNGAETVKTEFDSEATNAAIKKAADGEGYRKWINNLFGGAEEKSGIRNSKDANTASGNRRSFEALHWENNLENIVKAMLEQDETGGAFFSGTGIWGVSAKKYNSISEIKNDSSRLRTMNEAEYNALKEQYGARMQEIAQTLIDPKNDNYFIASDDAYSLIVDAVRNSKDESGILRYLKKYNSRATEKTAYDIAALVRDIAEMPTGYFEAKPQRAVGFDEVKAVILPDNASGELVSRLESDGINTVTYKAGDENSRLEALNGVRDVRFSLARANDEYMKAVESGDTEEQRRLVDEAAKANGYDRLFWHGSKNGGGFTEFRDWSYFTENKKYASRYAKPGDKGSLYEVYANLGNTFDTRKPECREIFDKMRSEYGLSKVQESGLPDWTDGYDIAEFIDENGLDYDSIILDEGGDLVDGKPVSRGFSYVIRISEQVKSADPITYDDSGNVIPLTERFDSGNRDIRWSLAGKYDYSKSFADQIDDYKNGLLPVYDTFVVGETPKVWQDIGFNALPVTLNQTHVDYALNGTKDADHEISEADLKKLPEKIKEPIAIIQSQSNPSRAVVFIEMTSKNGKNVVTPVEVDGYGKTNNLRIDSNALASVFGKKNAANQLQTAIDNTVNGKTELFYWDKKRSLALLQGAGLQLPSGLPQDGFVHSIREPGSLVKAKMDDVTNSLQFKRWFGDWKGGKRNVSKVVNHDGSPRVVYHYTDADFEAFDTSKSGSNQGVTHGDGIYVSTNPTEFAYAGKNRLDLYASIKKPFEMQLTKSQAERVYDKYFAPYHDDKYKTYRPHVIEKLQSRSRVFDYLSEAADNGGVRTSDILKELGYDGIHDGSEWVAFDSTQLKSATDNIGTFDKDNPKLKYSLAKSTQSELKALQKENEKLRQDVNDLKQELQLTHGRKLSRDALISSIQKILIDRYGVKLSAKELYPHVTNLYDMFYNNTVDGKRLKKDERVDTMRIIEEMDKIVDAVIENAVGADDTYVEMKKLLPELRNTKLVVPVDERADAAQSAGFENWAEFRKANFGRVGFANEGLPVDSYYMELSERYPELFPDGITNPGEQAAHIADVVNTIRESGINEYQLYDIEDERIRTSIKNDVMDIIGNAEKLQTFADRAAQKVEDTKLAEAMHYGADIAKLKRLNAEKVSGIRAENQKRLSDMRRKYQDRVESVRERYAEARQNRSEKQKQTVLRNKVLRKYTEASTTLDRPTTENHFTEAMRKPLMEFLAAVDITTGKSVAKQGVYDRILRVIEAANNMAAEGGKNGLDIAETDLNVQEKQLIVDSGLLERMSAWIEANQGKKLTELSSAQLEELNGIFNQLKHLTAEIKRLYDPREGLAAKSWQAQKEIGLAQTKERKQVLGANTERARGMYEQVHFGALDPSGYYNTLGSDTMTAQFERFRRCQNRFSENIQMFTDRLGEIVDGAIPKDEHGKNAKEVTLKLSHGTLTATPAQLMSIHLMLNQEDSRRCLFNEAGGVIIGKFTAEKPKDGKAHIAGKRTFAQSGRLVLNEADAAKITAALTDGQRKRADAISALLNNEAARLGNEVSMAMYGYKKYTTENYFPMRTADDYRAIADNPNYEMNLLGLSFTKERTGRAGKALVAEDIYDVIGRHLTNMAQYNAFAQELDNAKKMYSLRLGDGTSLKQRIIHSYGREADAFYNKLINNLSGVQMYTNNSAEALSDKLLSNYKAAAVAGNVSVVLKQPMSIFRALPEFSLSGLKKSMAFEDILNLSPKQLKANTAEMLKYSGIARLKAWGSSENMTRKSFESLYNDNSDTARQKINEFLTSGAENADMWTWAKLWRMSKAEIDAQGKYTAGSKEYFEAVDRKFSDVIGKTQVVQSALDSSMAVQNAKGFGKFLFAFQNEPLKQYSYLISTLNDARRGKPGAKKKLAKVIASSLANAAAVSAISTFMAWLRGTLDRDDDDELFDDLMKEFAGNSIDDLLSGAFAPVWQYIDTIMGAINSGVYGNTVERLDMAALTDLGGLINKYFISQNGGRPNLGTVQDIVNVASNLFGLPAKNIFRDVKSVIDRIILELPVPSAAKYNYLKAWKDVELTNKAAVTEAYYDVLRDAVDRGRYSDYVKIKRDMIYHGYTETKIKNAVMKSSLMDDLYELKKVNPGSYKAKVNSIVSSVSAVSSLEGKEFEDFIESAMKRREREDGGSKTDDEVYDEMHRKMEKEVKEQLIYIDVSKRAAYIKKMLKTYGEYGITEADILKVLRKAGKA